MNNSNITINIHGGDLRQPVMHSATEHIGSKTNFKTDIGFVEPVSVKDMSSIDEESLNKRIEELKAEISRLEKSDCEFRAKVVELHTEMQEFRDMNDRITCDGGFDDLKTDLESSHKVILDISAVISEWLDHNKTSSDAVEAIKRRLTNYAVARGMDASPSPDAIPAVVREAVAELEKTIRDRLGDPSTKVVAHIVTPTQMSEMLETAKGD